MRISLPIHRIVPLLLLALAACQTVPPSPPSAAFSTTQQRALRENGFAETDRGWEFGMADRLLFASDDSRVRPEQADRISRIAQALRSVGIVRLRVEGYTDSTGRISHNDALSLARAKAVGDALVGGGLPRGGIVVAGLGQRQPIETNRTAAGRAENRRVVIVVPTP
ncbi:OmpA family protein [Flavisphingomonas formosensis]|uniref:OmpA family protein n=1 Tax=Flavisphingomonas formosensis TaxID=861534 RepID=UPI0012F859D8|nr:OmpA family protein [Sphingomonas formosensis]